MEELLDNDFKFGRRIDRIGLSQLRNAREETIERWSNLGFLEGLEGHWDDAPQLFESAASHLIYEEDFKFGKNDTI